MPWLRLDDDFISNAKLLAVGKDAKLLYFWSLGYAARELTDGLVKRHLLPILAVMAGADDPENAAGELVDAGLWEDCEDDYRISPRPRWEIHPDHSTQDLRNCREYEKWRTAVLQRDHHACTMCKKSQDTMHAHHIRAWADYPNLRFSIDNGATLCPECHMALHGLMPSEEAE